MVRMTAPNGAAVEVSDDKVEMLTRYGFSSAESKKAPAKKAASKKSASSDDR